MDLELGTAAGAGAAAAAVARDPPRAIATPPPPPPQAAAATASCPCQSRARAASAAARALSLALFLFAVVALSLGAAAGIARIGPALAAALTSAPSSAVATVQAAALPLNGLALYGGAAVHGTLLALNATVAAGIDLRAVQVPSVGARVPGVCVCGRALPSNDSLRGSVTPLTPLTGGPEPRGRHPHG